MSLNWNAIDTYYFVDQKYKMMLRQSHNWSPLDFGEGDSIGRTFISYFNYDDKRFLEGIENCWVKKESNRFWKLLGKKYYYQGYRYPTHYDEDMSRDHLSYTIFALIYSKYYSKEKLKEFIKHLKFRISKKFTFTINLWLWTRAAYGSKFYEWLFYTIDIRFFKFVRLWNKIIYKITPFNEESSQEEWNKTQDKYKPKSKREIKFGNLLYPIYSLHQQAWKLHFLRDSKRKKKLQKICLDMAPEHNYVIKILLGDKKSFTKEDVYNYKSMTGSRWTGILNPQLNDRDINIITDEKLIEFNIQDVDYVRKLYLTI